MTQDQCGLLQSIAGLKGIPFRSLNTHWGLLVFLGPNGKGFHDYKDAIAFLRAMQQSPEPSCPVQSLAGSAREDRCSEKSDG